MKFSFPSAFFLATAIIGIVLLALTAQTLPKNSSEIKPSEAGLLPSHLRIPKIGVNAFIESVGTTTDGAMSAPEGPSNAAWWNAGTVPGQIGSAVIDGHFGWKNGIPAVFDRLYVLKIGDLIYVDDSEGHTTTFVVRGLKLYGQNSPAPEVFHSSDGKAHLNLITCEGLWNATDKNYSNRLVVFADIQ